MKQVALTLLAAFAAPLFLLPLEKILPFPYLIEELFKLLIVFIFLKTQSKSNKIFLWVIMAAVLFTFSESVFYLTNIFINGNLLLFPQRLLLTGSLHLSTMLMMFWLGNKNLYFLILALFLTSSFHYFFNLFLATSLN